MVLQYGVRSPSAVLHAHHDPRDAQRPDPVRIAGIAGALLLNGAALMLMLAPLGRPATEPKGPGGLEAEWFEPRPVPPPPPPEVLPVQPMQPMVTPAAPAARSMRSVAPDPAPAAPPVVDGRSIAFEPVPPLAIGNSGTDGPAGGPLTGVRLAYADASAPPYPREAVRSGHQGTVTLRVLVDVDGRPLEVSVENGSGYRQLDEAARRHVLRHWHFQPAMRDGRPVQAIGVVPIDFRLDRG